MPDRVLPFYVVCDESYSMADHLGVLNAGLRELHRCVGADPAVSRRVRFCLIGFAENARVVVPLSPLGELPEVTGLTTRAATNFGEAFTKLRETIERDVAALRASSCEIYQPAVFFLSDGQPTDPALWRDAYAQLVDPAWPSHPKVVAFGIGDADAATIGSIGQFRAFLCNRETTTPATALRRFAETLADSMMRTGPAEGSLGMPMDVPGYLTVAVDHV